MFDFLKRYLNQLTQLGRIKKISEALSPELEISSLLNEFGTAPLIFENVEGSDMRLAGNLYATRDLLRFALQIPPTQNLLQAVEKAVSSPQGKSVRRTFDKSLWENNLEADLTKLPILKHYDHEAGKYITAGIVVAKFSNQVEENLSVHRMQVLGKNKVAARIVPRHLNQIASEHRGEKIPVSVVIGPPPPVFLAASLQTEYGQSEYGIASSLSNDEIEFCLSENSNIAVPIDSEIVLEGYLDYSETAREGPFVDLTGTYDAIREQPILTFERMHYNKDSVYQAILAGSSEHAIFMGLPQEIKIWASLSRAVSKIRGLNLTPAGGGYFHCVVSIQKMSDGDGKTAILNCFAASHPLKLVIAVDEDVDPYDLNQVEWALATRFQSDKGLIQLNGAKGSSLDPSSEKTGITSKLGLDATLPVKADRSKFKKASIALSARAEQVIKSLRI